MLLCVIGAGAARHVLDTKVTDSIVASNVCTAAYQVTASRPGYGAVTATVGSLVYDRLHERKQQLHRFFDGHTFLEYGMERRKEKLEVGRELRIVNSKLGIISL